MKRSRDPLSGLDLVFRLSALLCVMTIGPLLLGVWVDRTLNTSPFATLCLVLIGVLGGTIAMYQIIKEAYSRFGGR